MLRVGTWNLENLFRSGVAGGPSSQQVYEAKLAALAETIGRLAPDVLAVQEVGTPAALDDLVARVGGEWHVRTADPDGRGIRVGVMSRLPFLGVEQIVAFPRGWRPVHLDDSDTLHSAMGRAALHVRVRVGGRVVDVISCHWKSKLLTFPGGRFSTDDEQERARFAGYALLRRSCEAVTVRAAVSQLLAGVDPAVVVAGDLNDEADAATTQMLHGPPGSEIGTGGYDQADGGDGQRLWNLAARIPEAQRFSRVYRGRRELIDHILVSHDLVTLVDDGAVTTDGSGPSPSITDDPKARRDKPGSDHRPVVATVTL